MCDSSDEEDPYGPTLPPHLIDKHNQSSTMIGPQIPPNILANLSEKSPDLTEHIIESTDTDELDEGIGPFPSDDPRSVKIPKADITNPNIQTGLKREEWMLICPKNKTISEVVGQVGITSRKFLGRTPDEIKPPENETEEPDFHEEAKKDFINRINQERDEKMEEILKESIGSRGKDSLLSIHRKRKKIDEEKHGSSSKERRPFDRDVDLKVSKLNKDDTEKYIKKSSELSGRFSAGKKKFL